jgi:tungstate transport system ATP-binding protein
MTKYDIRNTKSNQPPAIHAMTAIYRLANLSKAYNKRTVLSIDDMAIRQGEVLAVIGPSGSGKTTLLRLLNFLELPDSGTLVFDNVALDGPVPLEQRRRVTAVFQHPALLRRSVTANIVYGMGLRGEKLSDTQLSSWLDRLGLSRLARQSGLKLSAGEGQRVALARALVIKPEVLLLDEPTANLDPYNIGLIERLVTEEHIDKGMTVVWVTHDIFQARRVADRVAFLLGGNLVELSETKSIFNSPVDSRTAAFLRGELVISDDSPK